MVQWGMWPDHIEKVLAEWKSADLTPLKEYFLGRSDVLMSIRHVHVRGGWECALFEQLQEEKGNLLHVGELFIGPGTCTLRWYGDEDTRDGP